MAAPIKLNKQLIEKMANYCRAGAYVETAAIACGVSKPVFYLWLKKGNKQKTGLYRALLDALDRAQGEWELRDISNIDACAMGRTKPIPMKDAKGNACYDEDGRQIYLQPIEPDWKASAWRLERKARSRWGQKQTLEHTGPDGGPQVIVTLPDNGRSAPPEGDPEE